MSSIQCPEVFSHVGGEVRLMAKCAGQICREDALVSKERLWIIDSGGKEECGEKATRASPCTYCCRMLAINLLTFISELQDPFSVKSG